MTVKTWQERSEATPDMDWLDKNYEDRKAMKAEIAELRAELERKEASVSFYSQKYDACMKELAEMMDAAKEKSE